MFQSGTDLLKASPGAPVLPAVELLGKVQALPAVGSVFPDLIKHAKVLRPPTYVMLMSMPWIPVYPQPVTTHSRAERASSHCY